VVFVRTAVPPQLARYQDISSSCGA